tara:strand:+ start:46112 stop:50587 length:4476 start_codon:yes stop_codon:yes gene_type:complete
MTKINPLHIDQRRLLGKNLPTPIFEKIILNNPDPSEANRGDLRIDHKISISFTLPPEGRHDAQYLEAKDIVKHYLDDLYLYVYVSPFYSINTALEEKRLNIRDLFAAYSDKEMTKHNFVGPGYEGTGLAWDFPTQIYPYIIEYMQQIFLNKTAPSGDNWFEDLSKATDDDGTILGYDKETARTMLNNPSFNAIDGLDFNPIFRIFWGKKGISGRWNGSDDVYTGTGGGRDGGGMKAWMDENGYTLKIYDGDVDGSSFMYHYLEYTLSFLVRGGYDSNATYRRKIPLKDLVAEDNDYESVLSNGIEYTKEGDEIFKISNISTFTLFNLTGDTSGELIDSYTSRLSFVEKLFSIAFVGVDVDTLQAKTHPEDSRSESYGWGIPYYSEDSEYAGVSFGGYAAQYDLMPRRPLANAYFGNIVYEHIMQNSKVVERPEEAFYRVSDNVQYDEVPLTSWDLRYYEQKPVGRAQIINAMRNLISNYSDRRGSVGSKLDNNIRGLEYILEVHKDSADLLIKFRNYMGTYSDKSPATPSGTFYSNFKTIATDFAKAVMNQERVTKRLFRNVIVQDNRAFSGLLSAGQGYVAPRTYNEDVQYRSGTEDEPFGDYIPRNWTRYHSAVYFKKGADGTEWNREDSEWWQIYLSFLAAFTGMHGEYSSSTTGLGYDIDLRKKSADLEGYASGDTDRLESYQSAFAMELEGYGWQEMSELAIKQANLWFHNNMEYSILGLHDTYDSFGFAGGGWSSYDHKGDRVVINKGHFFFDWEKALGTQSALSQVLSPAAIERFLGWKIPYKRFPVIISSVARCGAFNETVTGNQYIECRMGARPEYNDYTTGTTFHYPRSIYSLSNCTGKLGYVGHQYAHCNYPGDVGDSSDDPILFQTYLKFINFDVVNGDTFTGKRTLRDYTKWTPEWPFNPVLLGTGVCGDYRLMCFEFQDIMDDNYAYFNFYVGHMDDDDKNDYESDITIHLESKNTEGEPFAQYKFYVGCYDDSLLTIKDIYDYIIVPVRNRFNTYSQYCTDFCTYNNIENKFNLFFANSVEEHYNVGTKPTKTTFAGAPPPQPPWFETPYLIAALRMLVFRKYDLGNDKSNLNLERQIMTEAQQLSKQCNPRTGTKEGVENIKQLLEGFYDMFRLQESGMLDKIHEVTGIDTIGSLSDLQSATYAITSVTNASEGFEQMHWRGGALPLKAAYFVGSVQCDQRIFGEVLIESRSPGDIEFVDPADIPELQLEQDDVNATDAGPAGDGFEDYGSIYEMNVVDNILGATAQKLNDMLELQSLVQEYNFGRAGMVESLAAIEMALGLGVGGSMMEPLAQPSDWVLDGTIIWESIVNTLVTNEAGTGMHAMDRSSLLGGGFASPDIRIAAENLINEEMLSMTVDSKNIIKQFEGAHTNGIQPSFLASSGGLLNMDNGLLSLGGAAGTRGIRGFAAPENYPSRGDYLAPPGATSTTRLSLSSIGVGAAVYGGFSTGMAAIATYTGFDDVTAITSMVDMNVWA